MTEALAGIESTLGGGVLGVAARCGDESFFYNAEVVFPTASCIKIAIVEELFQQRLDLARLSSVESVDFVGGSGVISTLTPPVTLPLGDMATLTLSISDNTASNACLRAVGGPEMVNARLKRWGIEDTRIHRPIKIPPGPGDPPFTATGTPADFLTILENLSEPTKAKMALCGDTVMLPRYLGPEFSVVHKTGSVDGVRNDVGYISRGESLLTVAVFTKNTPDIRWLPENAGCLAVGQVAKLLCEHFFTKESR